MAIDFPKLWVPPRPAIIRAATPPKDVAQFIRDEKRKRAFGVMPMFCPAPPSGPLPTSTATDVMQVDTGSTTSTSWTWNTRTIGTADPTRFIVACAYHPASAFALTCTINGTGMPRLISSTTAKYITAFGLAFPTGTTANFVLNSSSGGRYWGLCVYAVYNLNSTTPIDTFSNFWNSTTATESIGCNTVGGGVILSFATTNDTVLRTISWTGTTPDPQKQIGTSANIMQGARTDNTPAASPRSITVTPSGSTATFSALSVSFR